MRSYFFFFAVMKSFNCKYMTTVLMKLFGPGKSEISGFLVTELQSLYCSDNRIARSREMQCAYSFDGGTFGRLRLRWKDVIMDVIKVGCEDLLRNWYWAFVMPADINLQSVLLQSGSQ